MQWFSHTEEKTQNGGFLRYSTLGNSFGIFSAATGYIFAPDGTLIGKIHLPETCANLCFGGTKRNRLFMAASQSIYSLYVGTEGVPMV